MAKKKTNRPAPPALSGQWLMAEDRVKDLFSRVHSAAKKADYPGEIAGKSVDMGYEVEDGVATIPVIGVLTKYPCWLDEICGFTAAECLMECLESAMEDPSVKAIDLLIDSPGGMVEGTVLFAEAVAEANKMKPIYARVSDMCASGGYWIASQCTSISANETALVGCIGVYTVLTDDAKFWGDMGINFTLVSTGGVKGLGADGKVSAELVADVQREINGTYERFIAAVADGRGMGTSEATTLADGRLWIAKEAKQLGLIDSVASPEAAMMAIFGKVTTMTHEQWMSERAEHPDWNAGELDQAKKLGAKEARDAEKSRCISVREACAGNDTLTLDTFLAGKDSEDAKITLAAISKAQAQAATASKEATDKLAVQAKEIERLTALVGTQGAVGTSAAAVAASAGAGKAGPAPEAPTNGDPKALAAWSKGVAIHEWEADESVRKGFSSKENYIGFRAAELRGEDHATKPPQK